MSIVLIAIWALGVMRPVSVLDAALVPKAPDASERPVGRGYDVSALTAAANAVLELVKSVREDRTEGGSSAFPFFETNIGRRSDETQDAKSKSDQLAAALGSLQARLMQVLSRGL